MGGLDPPIHQTKGRRASGGLLLSAGRLIAKFRATPTQKINGLVGVWPTSVFFPVATASIAEIIAP